MRLTRREVDALEGLVRGETAQQQALRMGLSESTIRSHRSSLYRKLGVSNAPQAVVAAFKRAG